MSQDEYEGEFSVCQFFPNGQYEYVRRFVPAQEAVEVFKHYVTCVGARLGTTRRVIITDGGDCVAAEWTFEEGFTFPPEFVALNKKGEVS